MLSYYKLVQTLALSALLLALDRKLIALTSFYLPACDLSVGTALSRLANVASTVSETLLTALVALSCLVPLISRLMIDAWSYVFPSSDSATFGSASALYY